MDIIEVFDNKLNLYSTTEVEKDYNFCNPSKKMANMSDYKYDLIFDIIGYDISVFVPFKNEDFLIKKFSKNILEFFNINSELKVKGHLLSETIPIFQELAIDNIIKKVQDSGKEINFYIKRLNYNNSFLFLECFLIKKEDYLVLLTKNQSKSSLYWEINNSLFDNSIQSIITIQNNKFLRVNPSFLNLFGFKEEKILNKEFNFDSFKLTSCSNNELKTAFDEILANELTSFEINFISKKINGEIIYLKACACGIFYNNNPAIDIYLYDVSDKVINENRRKFAERELESLRNDLRTVQDLNSFTIIHWNISFDFKWRSNVINVLELNETSPIDNSRNLIKEVTNYEAYLRFENAFLEATNKKEAEFIHEIPIITGNGNKKFMLLHIYNKYENDELIEFVGYLQDITDSVMRKELKKSLTEREVLLREVHHRVKNNLQIILSLLRLDQRFNRESPEEIIESTKNRISTMALIHEKTYKSEDLSSINFKEYVETEIISLLKLYDMEDILLEVNIPENLSFNMNIITPLGLMINEMITNTIKYAFPIDYFQLGHIYVDLEINIKEDMEMASFCLRDNGKGFPEDLDIYKSPSLGLTIINSLTNQIEGKLYKLDCDGAGLRIDFPISK